MTAGQEMLERALLGAMHAGISAYQLNPSKDGLRNIKLHTREGLIITIFADGDSVGYDVEVRK